MTKERAFRLGPKESKFKYPPEKIREVYMYLRDEGESQTEIYTALRARFGIGKHEIEELTRDLPKAEVFRLRGGAYA